MEHLMLTMLLFMMDHCHLVDVHKSHDPCKYSYNISLPNVEYMAQHKMADWLYEGENVSASQRESVSALYHEGTIYLPTTWNKKNKYDLSDLVHELYHHVQHTNDPNTKYLCDTYIEIPAYEMQLTYLKYKYREHAYIEFKHIYTEMPCNTKY